MHSMPGLNMFLTENLNHNFFGGVGNVLLYFETKHDAGHHLIVSALEKLGGG